MLESLRSPTRLADEFIGHTVTTTSVPLGTVKKWRAKLKKDLELDLFKDPRTGRSNVLDRDIERLIYNKVVEAIHARAPMPGIRIRMIAKELADERKINGFKAGRTWLQGFLLRWHLSLRKAHLRRRAIPNDAIVAEFLQTFEMALLQYCPDAIINMDESSWHVFNGTQIRTAAETGADDISLSVDFDEKKCITIIAAITLSGKRLPLWFLAKGKTVLCEKKFNEHDVLERYISDRKIIVIHSSSGLSTDDLMKNYID